MVNSESLGFFQKLAAIILKPREFFAGVEMGTRPVGALKFYLAIAIATALLSDLLSKAVTTGLIGAVQLGFVGTVTQLALNLVLLFVLSAISQAIGRILFKAGGNYWDTLRVFSYYAAASIAVQFIGTSVFILSWTLGGPGILGYVYLGLLLYEVAAGLYLLHILSVGLSIVHGISLLKALVMGVPWVVVLVLLIASAVAAYLWVMQVQSLMAAGVTGSFDQSMKAQATRFCIESVWNESTAIKFTMRNCGMYNVSQSDFAQTGYYIDNVKTACTPDVTPAFNINDMTIVTCPPGSYGACTSSGCQKRTIKVVTAFGWADTVTYQYAATS